MELWHSCMPAVFSALTAAEQRQLRDLVRKLLDADVRQTAAS